MDDAEDGDGDEGGEKKKKKKRNKKKGKNYGPREQDNSDIRLLGSWTASDNWKQSIEYSNPILKQFPDMNFPEGEMMNHPGDFNLKRITDAEYRAKDRLCEQ